MVAVMLEPEFMLRHPLETFIILYLLIGLLISVSWLVAFGWQMDYIELLAWHETGEEIPRWMLVLMIMAHMMVYWPIIFL